MPHDVFQVQHLTIDEHAEGQRVDNFLLKHLKGVPKARIYRMVRSGEVRLDGARVKAESRLHAGGVLRVPPIRLPSRLELEEGAQRALEQRAEDMVEALRVVYEGHEILAVDKPAGLAVHGGSGIDLGVVEALRKRRPAGSFLELAHRLDRDTSGLLLLASSRPALLWLHQQLREGLMRKRYLAVVQGFWPSPPACGPQTLIKAPLLKTLAPNGERWVRVDARGQPSLTRVRLLARGQLEGLGDVSLLQCEPLTGRTHQIRVHLQSKGFPILGDPKYGDSASLPVLARAGLRRMFLHAWRLELSPIAGAERIALCAEPSEEFARQLRRLGLTAQSAPCVPSSRENMKT